MRRQKPAGQAKVLCPNQAEPQEIIFKIVSSSDCNHLIHENLPRIMYDMNWALLKGIFATPCKLYCYSLNDAYVSHAKFQTQG